MVEIRFVGPGKTCGYPYSVCKKELSIQVKHVDFFIWYAKMYILAHQLRIST